MVFTNNRFCVAGYHIDRGNMYSENWKDIVSVPLPDMAQEALSQNDRYKVTYRSQLTVVMVGHRVGG